MEYIGDHQESVNIRCIQRRESVTLELLHLVRSLVYSKTFSENHFPIGCQLCMTHIKGTNKTMKVSEDNDNSMVSEYTEIFEAEALSQ